MSWWEVKNKLVLSEYKFSKKCDFDMCQNTAAHELIVGAKGSVLVCNACLEKLRKILKVKSGGSNERTKN